jgi:hypothetical protein
MTVTLIEAGLHTLLDLPTSPVGRNVTERAERVAEQARENVRANFRSRTGDLERSIGTFPSLEAEGLAVEVGTNLRPLIDPDRQPYGLVLELGDSEHPITRRIAPILRSPIGHPDPLDRPRIKVTSPTKAPRPWLKPALETVFLGG